MVIKLISMLSITLLVACSSESTSEDTETSNATTNDENFDQHSSLPDDQNDQQPSELTSDDLPDCEAMSVEECEMFFAINDIRNKNGVSRLKPLRRCIDAAGSHSTDMAENTYLAHDSPTESWNQRMQRFQLSGSAVGENIAMGRDISETVNSWMNSSGHRTNILNATYKSTGVGFALSASGIPYWVQCFSSY